MEIKNKFSQQIKKSNTDEWFTQENDVKIIVPYILKKGYKKILCPFDKADSNFVNVLEEEGFDVSYSHIEDGVDFFEIQNLSEYDAIVSNPPFSQRQRVFERLFESKVPFAMIMNFNGLFDSKSRWEMFKNNDFGIIVPNGRMKFFDENKIGNAPNFQAVYVCSGIVDNQITFVEMIKNDGK